MAMKVGGNRKAGDFRAGSAYGERGLAAWIRGHAP